MAFVTINNGKNRPDYKPNDKIYTPENIAKLIISKYNLYGKVLDPFRGGGVFYNNLPDDVEKFWCEIDDNRDFYDFNERVDWIISNPPYSDFTRVMNHSYKIADNIVYLIPLNKIVSSWGRIKDLNNYGGIVSLFILPANKCGFPFGFPVCACYMKRDYQGEINWELDKNSL